MIYQSIFIINLEFIYEVTIWSLYIKFQHNILIWSQSEVVSEVSIWSQPGGKEEEEERRRWKGGLKFNSNNPYVRGGEILKVGIPGDSRIEGSAIKYITVLQGIPTQKITDSHARWGNQLRDNGASVGGYICGRMIWETLELQLASNIGGSIERPGASAGGYMWEDQLRDRSFSW